MPISDFWDLLVDGVCRPPRDNQYGIEDLVGGLGCIFQIADTVGTREDVTLVNKRGLRLACSHYRPANVASKDGKLPCVVYAHCNSGSRRDAEEAVFLLVPLGISVFAIDFSGSGVSEGQWVTLGASEAEDVAAAVSYLRATGRTSTIGLWGRSMGAVTALMYAHRDPSIAAMVLDSPFCRLTDLITEVAQQLKLPIPKYFLKRALGAMRRSVQKRAGFDINQVSPLDLVTECKVPALFGHGTEDNHIDIAHSRKLHDAYAGERNIIFFGGNHLTIRPTFFYLTVAVFFHRELGLQQDPTTAPLNLDTLEQLSQLVTTVLKARIPIGPANPPPVPSVAEPPMAGTPRGEGPSPDLEADLDSGEDDLNSPLPSTPGGERTPAGVSAATYFAKASELEVHTLPPANLPKVSTGKPPMDAPPPTAASNDGKWNGGYNFGRSPFSSQDNSSRTSSSTIAPRTPGKTQAAPPAATSTAGYPSSAGEEPHTRSTLNALPSQDSVTSYPSPGRPNVTPTQGDDGYSPQCPPMSKMPATPDYTEDDDTETAWKLHHHTLTARGNVLCEYIGDAGSRRYRWRIVPASTPLPTTAEANPSPPRPAPPPPAPPTLLPDPTAAAKATADGLPALPVLPTPEEQQLQAAAVNAAATAAAAAGDDGPIGAADAAAAAAAAAAPCGPATLPSQQPVAPQHQAGGMPLFQEAAAEADADMSPDPNAKKERPGARAEVWKVQSRVRGAEGTVICEYTGRHPNRRYRLRVIPPEEDVMDPIVQMPTPRWPGRKRVGDADSAGDDQSIATETTSSTLNSTSTHEWKVQSKETTTDGTLVCEYRGEPLSREYRWRIIPHPAPSDDGSRTDSSTTGTATPESGAAAGGPAGEGGAGPRVRRSSLVLGIPRMRGAGESDALHLVPGGERAAGGGYAVLRSQIRPSGARDGAAAGGVQQMLVHENPAAHLTWNDDHSVDITPMNVPPPSSARADPSAPPTTLEPVPLPRFPDPAVAPAAGRAPVPPRSPPELDNDLTILRNVLDLSGLNSAAGAAGGASEDSLRLYRTLDHQALASLIQLNHLMSNVHQPAAKGHTPLAATPQTPSATPPVPQTTAASAAQVDATASAAAPAGIHDPPLALPTINERSEDSSAATTTTISTSAATINDPGEDSSAATTITTPATTTTSTVTAPTSAATSVGPTDPLPPSRPVIPLLPLSLALRRSNSRSSLPEAAPLRPPSSSNGSLPPSDTPTHPLPTADPHGHRSSWTSQHSAPTPTSPLPALLSGRSTPQTTVSDFSPEFEPDHGPPTRPSVLVPMSVPEAAPLEGDLPPIKTKLASMPLLTPSSSHLLRTPSEASMLPQRSQSSTLSEFDQDQLQVKVKVSCISCFVKRRRK